MTMNNWRFLACPLDAQKLTQQLNLQLLSKKNLLKIDDSTTKLAVNGSTWGVEPAALNRSSDVGIQWYFALVFIL